MLYLIAAVLWPLAFVGLHYLYPLILPGKTPPDSGFLMLTALLGMAAFIFAGALRMLGFLRDDKVKREKSRAEAGDMPPR